LAIILVKVKVIFKIILKSGICQANCSIQIAGELLQSQLCYTVVFIAAVITNFEMKDI